MYNIHRYTMISSISFSITFGWFSWITTIPEKHLDLTKSGDYRGEQRRAAVPRCCSSSSLLQGRHLTWPFSSSWASKPSINLDMMIWLWNTMKHYKYEAVTTNIGLYIHSNIMTICDWSYEINPSRIIEVLDRVESRHRQYQICENLWCPELQKCPHHAPCPYIRPINSNLHPGLLPLWKLFGLCHLSEKQRLQNNKTM